MKPIIDTIMANVKNKEGGTKLSISY